MSSLNLVGKRLFERLLGMSSGYVANFSDRTFGEFFADQGGIDIHSARYRVGGSSKANKLRTFWDLENDVLVGTAMMAMIDHWQASANSPTDEKLALAHKCREEAMRLQATGTSTAALRAAAVRVDAAYLHRQIGRMEGAVHSDPDLAIGTAKELVETVCKTILRERNKPAEGSPDIPALTKAVMRELRLVPEGVPDETRGADTIRRMLSNLASIVQGVTELRNLYGTGHGQDGLSTSLGPRHAKLAAGAAATLTAFLFETHMEQPQ